MKTRYIIAIAAALASCIACQKNDIGTVYAVGDSIVRFAPSVSGGNADALTKGELYNETTGDVSLGKYVDDFMVAAWSSAGDLIIPDGTAKAFGSTYVTGNYQKVARRNNADYDATDNPDAQYWMTVQPQTVEAFKTTLPDADDEYIWKSGEVKTFYAYANLPESGANVTNADATGQTLEYTAVPATAAAQNDILLGYYKGEGKTGPSESMVMTGTAGIVFQHPLTAVRFKKGEVDENIKIKSIRLEGVANSGTATMNNTGAIAWSSIEAYTHAVSQSAAGGLSVDNTSNLIGESFIIIPQNVATNNVKVIITTTDDKTFTAIIGTLEWEKGCTNTYTVNIAVDREFTLTGPEVYNGGRLGGDELNDDNLTPYNGTYLAP